MTRTADRAGHGGPAYARVAAELRELVIATDWHASSMLPPEPVLCERFGVSRGTVRRATEELVREGLVRAQQGHGTVINRHAQVRLLMRDRLARIALPDSRWHLDVLRFVPDFAGSAAAHERLCGLDAFADAETAFIAPDNSLTALITRALEDGRRVVVPTYGLRRGMVLLDPRRIAPADFAFASTLDGLERFGRALTLAELGRIGRVDAMVTGAVAFTRQGVHVGNGAAYFDIEWTILAVLDLVGAATPVIGLSHDDQVLDVPLVPKPDDMTVDTIVTPTAVLTPGVTRPRPRSLTAARLRDENLAGIPYLADLYLTHQGGQP